MWNPLNLDVNILGLTDQIVHCKVYHNGLEKKLSLTDVYGANDANVRKLWQDLVSLKADVQGAWIIRGHFNNKLNLSERIGSDVPLEEVGAFRQCLRDYG